MNNDIKKISVSKEQISEINCRLGKEICKDFEGKNPLFIGLLKGCVPFMCDLLKNVTIQCTTEYVKVSSYYGTPYIGVLKEEVYSK